MKASLLVVAAVLVLGACGGTEEKLEQGAASVSAEKVVQSSAAARADDGSVVTPSGAKISRRSREEVLKNHQAHVGDAEQLLKILAEAEQRNLQVAKLWAQNGFMGTPELRDFNVGMNQLVSEVDEVFGESIMENKVGMPSCSSAATFARLYFESQRTLLKQPKDDFVIGQEVRSKKLYQEALQGCKNEMTTPILPSE